MAVELLQLVYTFYSKHLQKAEVNDLLQDLYIWAALTLICMGVGPKGGKIWKKICIPCKRLWEGIQASLLTIYKVILTWLRPLPRPQL